MKKAAIAMIVSSVIGLTACQQQKAETTEVTLDTAEKQEAYSIGANLGTMVQERLLSDIEGYDHDLVVKGFSDAIAHSASVSPPARTASALLSSA